MKRQLSIILPESLKAPCRPYLNGWKARRLAAKTKRLDICAAQLAHVLHLAGRPSLLGKTCLELGAGWVLSHALVFHLLGAKKVLAVDIEPLAHPSCLKTAVHQAVRHIIQDILSPFEDYGCLRERLDRMFAMKRFDFNSLRTLGIEYVSPFDVSSERLGTTVDFIYSNSVLEHVPLTDVCCLLNNLAAALSPTGFMMHCIHLEDHQDFARQPFRFLQLSAEEYPRWRQTNTGNRLRASGWTSAFESLDDCRSDVLYAFRRWDVALPPRVDSSIAYDDEMDLRVSHLGVLTQRRLVVSPSSQPQWDDVHDHAC